MARNHWNLSTSADFSTGTAQKTILQVVAAATDLIVVSALGIGFEGTSVTQAPIVIFAARQTTAGTMTGRNPLKRRVGGPALATTGQENASAEPTTTDIVWGPVFLHPQGTLDRNFRFNAEIEIDASGRVGFIVISPTAVDCRAYLEGEE